MIEEYEQVALTVDLPDEGLQAGDVGTVVDITPNGLQVTVEFFNFAGSTIAVVPVEAGQVRPLTTNEVLHARAL
jgi:hypothetical protein